MKIYLAGTSVSKPENALTLQKYFKMSHRLHSYFHCKASGFENTWFLTNVKNKVDIFLDSGAFTATTKNVKIDIHEYIDFIKQYDTIKQYCNLDVIGDAAASLKNLKIMEKHGMSPLPVFHYGEDPEKYLVPMIKKYDYIALGGLVGASSKALIMWLDTIFAKYICDENGFPKIKVHGFGITTFRIMFRYPWYSVDSTTWVTNTRLGMLIIPIHRKTGFAYDVPPIKIPVSFRSPSLKEANKHISTLSENHREVLMQYLHEHKYVMGKSEFKTVSSSYTLQENESWYGKANGDKREVEVVLEKGVGNSFQLRDELNVMYYIELEKYFRKYPWPMKIHEQQQMLF